MEKTYTGKVIGGYQGEKPLEQATPQKQERFVRGFTKIVIYFYYYFIETVKSLLMHLIVVIYLKTKFYIK